MVTLRKGLTRLLVPMLTASQLLLLILTGNYRYIGRLVIDFDENGNIIPESYDTTVSGAYATDEAGVAALNAEGLVDS